MSTTTLTERVVTNPSTRNSDLQQKIEIGTFRQIRELRVTRQGEQFVLRGLSQTFYAKQLATKALLDAVPGVALSNEILVVSAT